MQLLLKVESNVAEFLLDVSDNFSFSRGREWITSFHQVLDEKIGQITPSKIETQDCMRESETFVDGDGVCDTISRIKHDTGGTTRGVK